MTWRHRAASEISTNYIKQGCFSHSELNTAADVNVNLPGFQITLLTGTQTPCQDR